MFSRLLVHSVRSASLMQCRCKTFFKRGRRFLFVKNLFITNTLSSGILMALGDMIQQEIDIKTKCDSCVKERYNWSRLLSMFKIGILLGPFHHLYYLHVDQAWPGATIKIVAKKVFADQIIASPISILFFFYGTGIFEKQTISETTEEVKRKFFWVYMGDCLFWPPVQVVNFLYFSSKYRVVFVNVATIFYNVFLSYMKHFDHHH